MMTIIIIRIKIQTLCILININFVYLKLKMLWKNKRQIPYNSYAKPDGLIFKSANLSSFSSSSSFDNKSKWPLRTRINDVEEYTIHMVLDGWMNEQMNRLMVWKSVRHEHKHSWIKKKILLHFYLVKNFFFGNEFFFWWFFFSWLPTNLSISNR